LITGWIAAAWLAALPRAGAAWVTEEAKFPFVLRADCSLAATPGILAELRQLQDDLVETLGIEPAEEWIEIYVYRDRAALNAATRELLPGVEPRPALFVQGHGRAMVLTCRGDTLATDLRHETTHAILQQFTGEIPLWLDEGLAEYFEEPRDRRAGGHAHLAELREPGAVARLPSLERLERAANLGDLSLRDYQSAWLWTHYLLHGPPALQAELRAFLADSAEQRGKLSFGDRLRKLDPAIERRQQSALEVLLRNSTR